MIKHFFLAWRLLLRDWRAGELKILVLALVIAVASMTSIGLFTQRIDRGMTDQAGQFLGADLLFKSPVITDDAIIKHAHKTGLETSKTIGFSSVIVANEKFQLTHIKAVDQYYPLLSQIKIANKLYGEDKPVEHGPAVGEVWLAPRLFSLLDLKLGDEIELGETYLRVSAVLKHDPGQASSFVTIAPHLLMNIQDINKTGIVKPGSRVTYSTGFAGKLKDRRKFEKWISPRLSSSQTLVGGTEGSQAINSAMDKAEQYLSLASMLSVMLSGIAIAMTANRYGQRHFDQSALMRCMGASQKTIIQIFSTQLLILGVLGSLLGCLTGYMAQEGLIILLKEFLDPELPSPGIYPLASGFVSGLVTLTGFSLPALLRLKAVSPLRVLRNDITPLPVSSLFVYGLAVSSMIVLMWWQSGQFLLTLLVVVGVIVTVLMLFILSLLLIYISRLMLALLTGPWKTGLQQIIRNRKENQLQMLAFGLSLMILMIIFLLRTDLISRWQGQLPTDAPNHFVINIQADEVDKVQNFFAKKQIKTEGLYPMVRGRIVKINNKDVFEAVPDKTKLDNALKRDLNLSWAYQLQANNKLIDGQWWSPTDAGKPVISIEKGLARRLQVGLGDSLTFNVADQSITATIKSIRSVQWDSFQPNFFVIFPDSVLNKFPVSYISSFYIKSSQKKILNNLIKEFPTLTVLEVDAIMQQVKSIMEQVTTAVEYVMLFVLFAGMVVLVAAMQSSMDQRINASVIMRTLGAKKSFLRRSQLSEFSLLGLFSGVLAVSGTEIIAYLLYNKVFDLDFEFHLWLWLSGPLISILLILMISWLYMRKVTEQSPVKALRYS
ncbi:MAG: FtsX-like permease family protein [Gammaproteobacteria bacterium]|nr:FtsX-like permease family protein [Gammaproteobacteria bacterium]